MAQQEKRAQFDLTSAQMEMLWARFHERVKGFSDFPHPGDELANEEIKYKRAILKRFEEELGAEKLSALVAQGHGIKAVKEIARVLASNIVSFHNWNSFGKTDPVA